jgi:pentatricopeptide repeat protein
MSTSTINNNELNLTNPNSQNSSISPILTDLGAALVFGLGFYFFKSHFKKSSDEKETNEKMKPLKEKIEDTLNKWDSAICLQKINSIIKNEVKEENFDPFMVLDQLQKNNVQPDVSTINTLLDTCSKLSDFKNFNRLCELMMDSESNLMASLPISNIVTFNIILKGINLKMCKLDFAERGEFCKGKIEILIQEINKRNLKPTDITLNTIIDIMIESGNFDLAWKYFYDMENVYEVEPDIYTYSTLLKSIKNYEPDQKNIERAFEILKIFKLSKTKGIKPDEILFNTILDTCVKYGKMEQAESIFIDMKDAMITPSRITYAIMIRGFGNDYKLQKSFEIFEEMKANNITPNEIIFGCLLNACIKCNKIEKACQVYEEIKSGSSQIQMNNVLYSTLIKGYTRSKNFAKALEIYNEMLKDETVAGNIITYNAILDSCVECSNIEMMNKIYEEIKYNAIQNELCPQPDLITYSTVIKGYSRVRDFNKVLDIYFYLKGREDIILDEVIFNSILDGLLKSQKFEDALKVYEDMKRHEIKRSNATFSILIKIFSKMNNVEKAVEVYNEMISEKMKPSLITYTSILQILIKSKRIQNAIEIFEEILQNKMNPDQVLFNVIINGCVFNGRLQDACKFLFESFNANIRLCGDVYNNILRNLLTNRVMEVNQKNETAVKVCNEMKNRGMEIDYEIYHKIMKMVYKNQGNQNQFNGKREYFRNTKNNNNGNGNKFEERSFYSENNAKSNRKNNYDNNYNNQGSYENYDNYGYGDYNQGYGRNNYRNKYQKY